MRCCFCVEFLCWNMLLNCVVDLVCCFLLKGFVEFWCWFVVEVVCWFFSWNVLWICCWFVCWTLLLILCWNVWLIFYDLDLKLLCGRCGSTSLNEHWNVSIWFLLWLRLPRIEIRRQWLCLFGTRAVALFRLARSLAWNPNFFKFPCFPLPRTKTNWSGQKFTGRFSAQIAAHAWDTLILFEL